MEIWNEIPEFEGQYQASDIGRIKSLKYGKERILKPIIDGKGYLVVFLYKNGKQNKHKVHRLVWMAFNGEIPEGYEINHKSECKTDNRLENLELVTRKENCNWGTRNKRVSEKQINDKTKSKPVFQYDKQGNLINKYPSLCEVVRQTGFSQGNISYCCTGKLKSAYGYVWKYKN